jgi:hypothetical protein
MYKGLLLNKKATISAASLRSIHAGLQGESANVIKELA